MTARVSIISLGPAAQRQIMTTLQAAQIEREVKAETRANKFNAKRCELDGLWFDSHAERDRYAELKILERAGKIAGLECQPVFPIVINGNKVAEYRADFAYSRGNGRVIEDVKGVKTPVYRLKKKLVEALYAGVRIIEVTK